MVRIINTQDKSSSGERNRATRPLPIARRRPMVHDGFIHLSLPEYGLKVQGWAADGPTESKAKVINPSPARFACGVTKVRRPSGLRLNAPPEPSGGPTQWNRRIPTCNGIAPKGNGSLQCCLANLERWLRRVPVPRHPDTPGVALTQGTNPQAAPRLGVLLWGLSVPMRTSSLPRRHSSVGAIARH